MTITIDTTRAIDTSADAFAERVFAAVLDSVDVFSMYIGEKLGLYAALAEHGPLTRDELAARADIHWRYAQEWLEQQAITGILAVDGVAEGPSARRYTLPSGHAEVLVDRDSLAFLAPFVRVVLAGGLAMPHLLEAYRSGGGISWAELGPDARTGQADMNRPWYLQSIGSEWFPRIPALQAVVAGGGHIADIACGEGWSSIAIAQAHPGVTVDGFDVDGPSIEAARRHAAAAGLSDRVRFHHADVADLEQEAVYDAVVGFEFVHDLPHPGAVLSAMRRMAKPGAPVVVLDENLPDGFGEGGEVERAMYGFSLLICLPDGMSHQPSAATGTVIRPETMRGYAREAGFADARSVSIDNDLWQLYQMIWQ
jgi:2-polyprenyl-3-methyl-5-hydroxy-6-metoxy-1,4-benzoquinol methylase